MAGFGDLAGLKKPRFSPIDIPIMGAFISLAVQVFFCYHIWVLNWHLWWLCVIIAVVSPIRRTSRSKLLRLSTVVQLRQLSVAQATGALRTRGEYRIIKSGCGVRSDTLGPSIPSHRVTVGCAREVRCRPDVPRRSPEFIRS